VRRIAPGLAPLDPSGPLRLPVSPFTTCPAARPRVSIFHFRMQKLSRAAGRSTVAAAAYRSGTRLVDAQTHEVHDFTRRRGVVHSELIGWDGERANLWNAAERSEKRKDAVPAREVVVSLPVELSSAGRLALARAIGEQIRTTTGGAVDLNVHHPSEHPQADQRNHHVHVQWTTRGVDAQGAFIPKKADPFKGLDGPKAIKTLRARVAALTNGALRRELQHTDPIRYLEALVDPRSFAERDATVPPESRRVPTVHRGPRDTALERRGVRTRAGDRNRLAEEHNQALRADPVLRYELAQAAAGELAAAARQPGPEGEEARRWHQGAVREVSALHGHEAVRAAAHAAWLADLEREQREREARGAEERAAREAAWAAANPERARERAEALAERAAIVAQLQAERAARAAQERTERAAAPPAVPPLAAPATAPAEVSPETARGQPRRLLDWWRQPSAPAAGAAPSQERAQDRGGRGDEGPEPPRLPPRRR